MLLLKMGRGGIVSVNTQLCVNVASNCKEHVEMGDHITRNATLVCMLQWSTWH